MKGNHTGKILGELEKEIMEIIWENEHPISVREVKEILGKKRQVAYTTVMTIMARLTAKGVLIRSLNGASYLYQSKISRERFTAWAVHSIFATAVSNLGEEVASYFLKEIRKLNPKKRQELLKILEGK